MARYISLILCSLLFSPLAAEDIHVAVAANFTVPARTIATAFENETGHRVQLSFGSSGKFYAQIKNGAPFHVLLSADQETPAKLVADGLAVAESRFTYAVGRLVLWSAAPGFVDEKGAVLKSDRFRHLAIANPKLAPYGRAAEEVLKKLGIFDSVRARFVLAENLPQAHQFVASRSAEIGFLSLSQLIGPNGRIEQGSVWIVPAELHSPIRQDAIVLLRGKENPAAAAFLLFLRAPAARKIIRDFGYEI